MVVLFEKQARRTEQDQRASSSASPSSKHLEANQKRSSVNSPELLPTLPTYSLTPDEGSKDAALKDADSTQVDDGRTMSYPPKSPVEQLLSDVSQPARAVPATTVQPLPKETMMAAPLGSRNARDMPVDLRGKRDWISGLFGCHAGDDHELDTWCTACLCPCLIYSRNKTRMDHLANRGSPEPDGGTAGGACVAYGLSFLLGVVPGCAMQIPLRATIRDRYSIDGTSVGDFGASICCYSCALTQEHIELTAEEHSFPRGVGGSSGVYYRDPSRYQL